MRLAIISDIHGNLEAFRQVLADIDRTGIDHVICLGDNIGYGPEPEAVIRRLRERNIISIMGNHELGATDPKFLSWFNMVARQSLLQTKEMLTEEAMAYCSTLPHSAVEYDCLFVHGCPPDSPLQYIFEPPPSALRRIFRDIKQKVCFVGHTHMLEIISFDGKKIKRGPITRERIRLKPEKQYIINVGSVGQPRDGISNEAKYIIWDDKYQEIETRFIPYDITVTANKIRALGWSEFLANRLF